MAQYNPQTQQGGGGGRGGGRGGGGYQGGRGPQQGRPMGAWQPSAPSSSLQQAVYRPQQQGGYHPQHHQHHGTAQQMGQVPPHYAVNPAAAAHVPNYNPYAQQGGYRGHGGWQPQGYPPQGGVYYPPQAAQASTGQSAPVVQPPKPREKKPLVITDKDGNVLDFRSSAGQKKSSLAAAAAAGADKNGEAAKTEESKVDAGSKLREAALARLKDTEAAKEKTQDDNAATSPAPEPEKKAIPPPATKKEEPPKVEAPTPPKAEEKKEEPKPERAPAPKPAKTLAAVAAAPPPSKPFSAAAVVKNGGSGGSSLQVAAKKPSLAAIAAAPPPAPKASAVGLRPGGKTRTSTSPVKGRIVYEKKALMKFKSSESCLQRPDTLPDMTIVKGPAKPQGNSGGNRGGGRRDSAGGGGNWDRGRRNSQNDRGGNDSWQRGKDLPNQKNKGGRNRNKGQYNNQPQLEGPVKPLEKTANRWRPAKNTSPLVAAEKQVKGILNKMTKEKFDRLSAQMIEIQILSYDMLTMMIHNVYEKAIDEPSFGDMYADLCVKLSKGALQANNDFVKVIESDEEPPTEGDEAPESQQSAGSSSFVVYRWSNDVSTTDDEIVGPFSSVEECIDAALNDEGEPQKRGEMQLELVKLQIKNGTFIKIMKKKGANPEENNSIYSVYFPVAEAEECGQQLSEIFLSEVECVSNAKKKNSFKRSLLNKCEDEFKKQDIYADWKKEKKEYDESKSKLTPAEQAEKEEELEFRRMKIKKQMLGNIKFIGQLYKVGLLKEKIMRFCIGSLLKLDELPDVKSKNPEYKDSGDMDMDEEDHEAICSMFTTIGATIDKPPAADFMKVCFTKIHKLSLDKQNLPARSRFMYKDLLELRDNSWVPRRDEGKAKTLQEIKKDFEKEERRQAQQSQQNYRNDNRRGSTGGGGGGGGGGYDNRDNRRGSNFGGRGSQGGGQRNRQSVKQQEVTDDDGFTVIARGGAKGHFQGGGGSQKQKPMSKSGSKSSFSALVEEKKGPSSHGPAPLSEEKLERRIKSIRTEFVQDPNNIDELLLSMDELSGTKDAGLTLVSKSADALLDCKEAERKAITEITRILFEKGKLSKADIQSGLADFIEFIDSMVMDCPKLYEYMGDWLSILFKANAVDAQWFCEAVEKTKTDPQSQAHEKLTRATISSIRNRDGAAAAKAHFGSANGAMNDLVGADQWKAMSNDLLG